MLTTLQRKTLSKREHCKEIKTGENVKKQIFIVAVMDDRASSCFTSRKTFDDFLLLIFFSSLLLFTTKTIAESKSRHHHSLCLLSLIALSPAHILSRQHGESLRRWCYCDSFSFPISRVSLTHYDDDVHNQNGTHHRAATTWLSSLSCVLAQHHRATWKRHHFVVEFL